MTTLNENNANELLQIELSNIAKMLNEQEKKELETFTDAHKEIKTLGKLHSEIATEGKEDYKKIYEIIEKAALKRGNQIASRTKLHLAKKKLANLKNPGFLRRVWNVAQNAWKGMKKFGYNLATGRYSGKAAIALAGALAVAFTVKASKTLAEEIATKGVFATSGGLGLAAKILAGYAVLGTVTRTALSYWYKEKKDPKAEIAKTRRDVKAAELKIAANIAKKAEGVAEAKKAEGVAEAKEPKGATKTTEDEKTEAVDDNPENGNTPNA